MERLKPLLRPVRLAGLGGWIMSYLDSLLSTLIPLIHMSVLQSVMAPIFLSGLIMMMSGCSKRK